MPQGVRLTAAAMCILMQNRNLLYCHTCGSAAVKYYKFCT